MSTPLQQELRLFLDAIRLEDLSDGFSAAEIKESKVTLDIFKGEAQVTLSLIERYLNHEVKLLEVGAGLCLLSLFLKSKDYKIVAVEPIAGGFDFFAKLKNRILLKYSEVGLHVLNKSAQQLSADADGHFGLIYSNNVVEHILDVSDAFVAMRSVLAKSGRMVHSCPNYAVPYEPHFGIPVLSFLPSMTAYFLRDRIAQRKDLWESLNFITYFKIKKIAAVVGCDIRFKKALTFEVFQRLKHDHEFRSRHHNTIAGKVFRVLEMTNTISLTKYVPAWASTPMVFTMTPKV